MKKLFWQQPVSLYWCKAFVNNKAGLNPALKSVNVKRLLKD